MSATLADIQRKYGGEVYPIYKDISYEPYMENVNAGGYVGVVLRDEKKDLILCNICEGWYSQLHTNKHLRVHNITTQEYREKFQILKGVQMQSKRISKMQSKKAMGNKNFLKQHGFSNKKERSSFQQKANTESNKSRKTIGYRNFKGYCPAQIIARIKIVESIVGRQPLDFDLRQYDVRLNRYLRYHFGSCTKGLNYYGFSKQSKKHHKALGLKGARYSDVELLGKLRRYVVDNDKQPAYKDFKEGSPSATTYINRFGSWRRAKMMAGLDQLLAEVKSK